VKKIVVILLLTIIGSTAFAQKTTGDDGAFGNNKSVRFFPNPAVSSINFEFKASVERGSTLQIYSFLGRRMANLPVAGSKMNVNLTDYIRGIYVFQLIDPRGRIVETDKFQVSK
jgi:hypothetical protein